MNSRVLEAIVTGGGSNDYGSGVLERGDRGEWNSYCGPFCNEQPGLYMRDIEERDPQSWESMTKEMTRLEQFRAPRADGKDEGLNLDANDAKDHLIRNPNRRRSCIAPTEEGPTPLAEERFSL